MRLLLVDNDSDTLLELRALSDALGYNVTTVHCSAVGSVSETYDLIVLSGGYWYDDELKHLENYAAELELIRSSSIPIVGICLGMQLMHVAFSGLVPLLDEPQTGLKEITLTAAGQQTLGLPETIQVFKNHTRGVISALEHFQMLAHSPGHLEIMQHQSLPLIGVQFHPEIGDFEQNKQLMQTFINSVMR